MSFTATQKADLVEILNRNAIQLDVQLAAYALYITAEMETKVIAQIARYNNGTVKGGVWFEGTESNQGFNMSGANTAASKDPKSVIETLLFFEDEGSAYQIALERG